jgi:hypothetical protein
MICLLPRPLPTTSPVSQIDRRQIGILYLMTWEEGMGGEEPNHTILKPVGSLINNLQTFLNYRLYQLFRGVYHQILWIFFEYYFNLFQAQYNFFSFQLWSVHLAKTFSTKKQSSLWRLCPALFWCRDSIGTFCIHINTETSPLPAKRQKLRSNFKFSFRQQIQEST